MLPIVFSSSYLLARTLVSSLEPCVWKRVGLYFMYLDGCLCISQYTRVSLTSQIRVLISVKVPSRKYDNSYEGFACYSIVIVNL